MTIEKQTYMDKASGVEVTRLTGYRGHSHHLYFTNPGWYDKGRKLLFSSDRCNRTNLFGVDLANGEIEQLTDLEPVPAPREVEFLRACRNPVREEVYFWHGLRLIALDLGTKKIRTLHETDPKWCVSMTNCSADGRFVCFGCWEDLSDRFEVDLHRGYVGFREIWRAEPLSRVARVPTDVGGPGEVLHEEAYWIGHVNTSPTRPEILTFCHEGPWERIDQRIWGLDANTGRTWRIRPTAENETVGHEYWYADGIHLGYHGRNAAGKPMLGHIRFDDTDRHEAQFPGHTGHIFSLDHRTVVGDGGGIIRVWKWEDGRYHGPRILCRHDSAMRIQQTHPHPRISPDGRYVVFSSDRSGYGNVYTVPLADFHTLPPVEE